MRDCKKAFHNFKHNGMHLTFPNGNSISTVFGPGTYSDNYSLIEKMGDPDATIKSFQTFMESNTVEVMIGNCGKDLLKKILKKYNKGLNSTVFGLVNVLEWLEIVNLLAKEKKDDQI